MGVLGLDNTSPCSRLWAAGLILASSPLACLLDNPAFDPDEIAGETNDLESGDGDGDPGDGDGEPGDGDGEPGDGDGDPGDGDGDDPGDGDGDPGDGDGDGDPGDGDGDSGDGDGDPNLCAVPAPLEPYLPFLTSSLAGIELDQAPNFDLAPHNCHLLMICGAEQPTCDPLSPYLAKVYSSGSLYIGESLPLVDALQMRFHPGGGLCEGATLDLDPSQYIELQVWNGQGFELMPVRLPCLQEYDVPLYVAQDGSTFWDLDFTEPAALWD